MEVKDTLIIAKEFGESAGARYYDDGSFSGSEFLEKYLKPRFEKAVENGYILKIDIDGFWGWPSSFVSGSFGKLSKEKGKDLLIRHLEFKSDNNPVKIVKVLSEIENPDNEY